MKLNVYDLVTEAGTKYEAWTDGYAVGFQVTLVSGAVRYIYLNPSNDGTAEDERPNVFVYMGPDGDPARNDTPYHHYDITEENA